MIDSETFKGMRERATAWVSDLAYPVSPQGAFMTPDLARHFVRPLIAKHPLPWRLDFDWTVEVYDATDQLVIKLMNAEQARELLTFAIELAAYDAQGAAEVRKLFEEAGIEYED